MRTRLFLVRIHLSVASVSNVACMCVMITLLITMATRESHAAFHSGRLLHTRSQSPHLQQYPLISIKGLQVTSSEQEAVVTRGGGDIAEQSTTTTTTTTTASAPTTSNTDSLNNDAVVLTGEKEEEITSSLLLSEENVVMDDVDDDDDDEEEVEDEATFLARTKILCQERNLPLEYVKNGRDVASTPQSPIQPGRLYRMGRVSDATAKDVQLLFQELGIRTLVDLRSPTELKDDPTLLRKDVFGNFTNLVWMERRSNNKQACIKVLEPGQAPFKSKKRVKQSDDATTSSGSGRGPRSFWRRHFGKKQRLQQQEHDEEQQQQQQDVEEQVILELEQDEAEDYEEMEEEEEEEVTLNILPEEECGIDDCPEPELSPGKERHFVSLMNEFKYVRGTLSKVRKRDIARSLLKSPGALVSRRVRTSCKKPFIKEINDGGLPMLNELLLRFGAPGIKYVLELCADADRHPVAFYCTAGKDRTGIIAAIIMALCGVSSNDIIEDYTLSANVYAEMNDHTAMVGALSQRNLNAKTFLGAPPHVMRDTLEAMEVNYGGVEGYCNWIGFGPDQQEKLRKALLL